MTHIAEHKVRSYECDAYNHVNNSVYPTGSDWLAAKTPGGTFAPAGVVAKFGSGVWGRGVRYCPGNP